MNERNKEQRENMVRCPACGGQGEFRGAENEDQMMRVRVL